MTPTDKARALGTYLDDVTRQSTPFDWRLNNCCHFAAGWVERVEGKHPMADLVETPDRRAATALVRRLGGSLAGAWSHQLSRAALRPDLAQVGDLVLVALAPTQGVGDFKGLGRAVGICAGRTVVCINAEGHCVHLPLRGSVCCWRVGVQR